MSGTERTRYDGVPMRDGEWGKRCPERDCPACVTGKYQKRRHNKKRRQEKDDD